ncbi:hypothetical protein [Cupriavidus basilensis]
MLIGAGQAPEFEFIVPATDSAITIANLAVSGAAGNCRPYIGKDIQPDYFIDSENDVDGGCHDSFSELNNHFQVPPESLAVRDEETSRAARGESLSMQAVSIKRPSRQGLRWCEN